MTKAKLTPEEPSEESLCEMPEIKPEARRHFGRGAEGLRNARAFFAAVQGRPRKGETAVGTTPRSVRLPNDAWELLDARAAELGITNHALARRILAEWLYTSTTVTPRAAVKVRKRRKAS